MNATQTLNRLQKAIDSIEEKNGYCLVASETENEKHVVTYNENYYATFCTCKSTTGDCYHRVAVDRHFEDKHPNFYAKVRKPVKQAAQVRVVQAYGNAGMGFYAERLENGQWVRFSDPETGKDVCHPRKGSAEVFLKKQQAARRAAYIAMFNPDMVA